MIMLNMNLAMILLLLSRNVVGSPIMGRANSDTNTCLKS